MKKLNDNPKNIDAYFRLVALWVVCEAFVGGIIHGIKLPISGIIIGSAAVICISLIGYYFPDKGMILKATIIVTIFKMMLSPQSPPMAYVAVFFQGVVGELCFFNKKYFTASSFFFALIALIESGLQRIIILTFVYGKNFLLKKHNSPTTP